MKTAIVIGATGDIGKAVCSELAGLGLQIVAVARDVTKLGSLKQYLEQTGATVITVSVDVSDEAAVKKFAADVHDLEPVVLVNAAGAFKADREKQTDPSKPALTPKDALILLMTVNLLSKWLVLKHLLPIMQKGSVIYTVSSQAASFDAADLRVENEIAYWLSMKDVEEVAAYFRARYPELIFDTVRPGLMKGDIADYLFKHGFVDAEYHASRPTATEEVAKPLAQLLRARGFAASA